MAIHSGKINPENVVIHYFDRSISASGSGHSVITPKIDKDGRIKGAPRGFFDEWDRSLDQLISGYGR